MALGKEYLKKIKNLCRVPDGGHSAKNDASGRRDPSGHFAEGLLFAEGQALGKGFFAEGLSLPRAPRAGPWQRPPLPSARDLALGKPRSPRQKERLQ